MRNDLTQDRLKALLSYDAETGEFKFLVSRGRVRAGFIAGHQRRDGYVKIKIDNIHYSAHRLAWLYVNGAFPSGEIDHRNGNPSDNRWVNLRDVSHKENGRNRCLRIDNTSGYQGVNFHNQTNRWRARIHIDGRRRHIGYFDTAELAHAAYAKVAGTLRFTNRHIYGDET